MFSKDTLFKQVTQEEIYLKFLNLSKLTKNNISSPFSDDKKPSFNIYKNKKGQILYKCHSTGKQGDCFQLVADLNNLDCKTDFKQVMDIICNQFNIIQEQQHFNFVTKNFDQFHLKYWLQGNWNVTKEVLQKYKVSALDKFEYWNNKKQEITKIKLFHNVLGFAYQVANNAELYIPKQQHAQKFFINKLDNSNIFGLEQLNSKSENLVICAGKKDCLILNANGIPAVTFRSENHFITAKQIKQLQEKTNNLFICYDNDNAGQTSATKYAEKYNLINIVLLNGYNDIADFFIDKNASDFISLMNNALNFSQEVTTKQTKKAKKNEVQTIFHVAENYLSKHYDFRFNTILLDVEYKPKNTKEWKICNEDSLFIEMQKQGINIQIAKLISILKSDFVPRYNPITYYFKNLKKWDGKDYIKLLVSHISTPTPIEFEYHLKKWLARCVKCMLIKGYFNKQAFIITDKGNGQNIGKSHFTKWLCPPTLPLNRSFEENKKDNLIKLATNAFIILDELDGITKKDLNSLKALFSLDEIRVRLPYARREETVQRTANFIGSTNEENFLVDPTGSVRWLVFHVTALNWEYSKKININDIWSQAYALAKDANFDESFTKQDVIENEKRNQVYQVRSPEAEMISLLFEIPNEKNQANTEFLTATEILILLKAHSSLTRLSPVSVGRALKLLKFERVKHKGIYGYNIVRTKKVLAV